MKYLLILLIFLCGCVSTGSSSTTRILNDRGQVVGYEKDNRIMDTRGRTIFYKR